MCFGGSPDPIPAPPPTAPSPTPKFGSGALFGISKNGNQELLINKKNFQNLGTRSLQISKNGKPLSPSKSSPSASPTKIASVNKNPYLIGKLDSPLDIKIAKNTILKEY